MSNSISFCSLYKKPFGRGEKAKTEYNALRGEVLSNIEEFESEYHGFVSIEGIDGEEVQGMLVGFRLCGSWTPPRREFKLKNSDTDEMSIEEHIYFVLEDAFTQNELYHAPMSEFVKVTLKPTPPSSLKVLREMIKLELNKP